MKYLPSDASRLRSMPSSLIRFSSEVARQPPLDSGGGK
jgi:hypothetical protein